jgi:hypothetical protein
MCFNFKRLAWIVGLVVFVWFMAATPRAAADTGAPAFSSQCYGGSYSTSSAILADSEPNREDFLVCFRRGGTMGNINFGHILNDHHRHDRDDGFCSPTPEPASMALMGSGLLALGSFLRFLKKK